MATNIRSLAPGHEDEERKSHGIVAGGQQWSKDLIKPLEGATRVSTQSWDELALGDRDVFAARLLAAGLPQNQFQKTLDVRDDVARVHRDIQNEIERFWATSRVRYITAPPEVEELHKRQHSVMDRLRELFSDHRVRVDEAVPLKVRIPLFVIGAPATERSTAEATLEHTTSGGMDWSVKLFGFGLSGSASMEVTVSATFPAAAGQTKMVIQEAEVTAERISVLEAGKPIATNRWRVDASKAKVTSAPGLVLLSNPPPLGSMVETYPLSGDSTGGIVKYQYTYKLSAELDLDLAVAIASSNIGLKAKIASTGNVKVGFELRAGRDYELHRVDRGSNSGWSEGLVWA